LATDDRADAFHIDPNEGGNTAVLIRESLIWESLISTVQIPDEIPETLLTTLAESEFTRIYATEYISLVRLAVLLVHDVPTAEEVVQDAFLAMHATWEPLRDSQKALAYLQQAVITRSRSVLRHQAVVDKNAPKPTPDQPSAERAPMALIERTAVVAALRELPNRQREAIVLRYYADLSEADIAAVMGISKNTVRSHTARGMAALRSVLEPLDEANQPTTVALPISIYLAEEDIHLQVEAAVEEWLAKANISIDEREQPIIGSWFRRMQATAKAALNSEAAQDVAMTAVHAADARLVLAQDANITATLLANLAPVIQSLQPTKDAVLRVGALLIIKVDWTVQVVQLTAAQQAILDHQPQLASAPHQIIAALQLPTPTPEHAASAAELRRP
jgi:RNA polymerase sigma-70 factor (sigma-E family)